MAPFSPPAVFLKSYADPQLLPQEGLPQVAFLGRSNAGKSSLINALTGVKDLARTSATPGQTKLVNFFDVGRRYHLVDLPGYGYAQKSKGEREQLSALIQGYLHVSSLLRLAVVIVDSRLGPTDADEEMMEYLNSIGVPFVIVANKIDKLSRSEMTRSVNAIRAQYPQQLVIAHSIVTGAGKGELNDRIHQALLL